MVPHPCISCIKSQHSPTGVSSAQRWRRNGNPILAIPKANISECLFYVDEMQAVEPSGAGSRCVRLSLGSGRAVPSQQLRAWQSLAEPGRAGAPAAGPCHPGHGSAAPALLLSPPQLPPSLALPPRPLLLLPSVLLCGFSGRV